MFGWFKRKPKAIEIIQEGLKPHGPFLAHRETGFDLSFLDPDWYKEEVTDKGFRVVGHHHFILTASKDIKIVKPQDGYTFVKEMEKSWLLFMMKGVEFQSDPREMYFANAVLIDRKMKE